MSNNYAADCKQTIHYQLKSVCKAAYRWQSCIPHGLHHSVPLPQMLGAPSQLGFPRKLACPFAFWLCRHQCETLPVAWCEVQLFSFQTVCQPVSCEAEERFITDACTPSVVKLTWATLSISPLTAAFNSVKIFKMTLWWSMYLWLGSVYLGQ